MNLDNSRSLSTCCPDVASEWNYERNGEATPNSVFRSSRLKVWWKCKVGHEWQARIDSRTACKKPCSCPYCNGRTISFERSLLSLFPELSKEIVGEDASKMFAFSAKKAKWKCKMGHEWEARIADRSKYNHGCPYCSGRSICESNSFFQNCKELLAEWSYKKNAISPLEISPWSHKKVWWECQKCQFEWEAEINQRFSLFTKCPRCISKIRLKNGLYFSSVSEAYYYLINRHKDMLMDKMYPKLENINIGKSRYDFFIPSENNYVEVTGYNERWAGWNTYFSKILKKKNYVENHLKASFTFIKYNKTKDIYDTVCSEIQNED